MLDSGGVLSLELQLNVVLFVEAGGHPVGEPEGEDVQGERPLPPPGSPSRLLQFMVRDYPSCPLPGQHMCSEHFTANGLGQPGLLRGIQTSLVL